MESEQLLLFAIARQYTRRYIVLRNIYALHLVDFMYILTELRKNTWLYAALLHPVVGISRCFHSIETSTSDYDSFCYDRGF